MNKIFFSLLNEIHLTPTKIQIRINSVTIKSIISDFDVVSVCNHSNPSMRTYHFDGFHHILNRSLGNSLVRVPTCSKFSKKNLKISMIIPQLGPAASTNFRKLLPFCHNGLLVLFYDHHNSGPLGYTCQSIEICVDTYTSMNSRFKST